MTIEKNYVDTHGQSEVAFAFCTLLGFQLLPRLKNLGRQKLYCVDRRDAGLYPHLTLVLAAHAINWEVIRPLVISLENPPSQLGKTQTIMHYLCRLQQS